VPSLNCGKLEEKLEVAYQEQGLLGWRKAALGEVLWSLSPNPWQINELMPE
jgi:hypothetical protein